MDRRFWKRLARAAREVYLPVRGTIGVLVQAAAWLAVLGFPAWAAIEWESVLPQGLLGKLLLGGLLLLVAVMGVQAAYRLLATSEDLQRQERQEARKKALSALGKVFADLLAMRGRPFEEARIQAAKERLRASVLEYGAAASATHPYESLAHMILYRRLNVAVDSPSAFETFIEAGSLMTVVLDVFRGQIKLFPELDLDESDAMTQNFMAFASMTVEELPKDDPPTPPPDPPSS